MVSDKKKKLVEKLTQQIKDYPVIAIVNMQNLPAQQLQNMRAQLLKKDVLIVMARRRLLQLALKNSQKENIDALIEKIKGMPAVLLSKENPFILYKILEKNKSSAPAKAGQEAPKDIVVPAGPTNFAPGPIISELAAVGIKTKVDGGKLKITDDAVVAKEGDTISGELASMLKRLDIQPMEIGLDLVAAWEDKIVFAGKDLHVDEEAYLNNIGVAFQEAFNLAMEVGYPTKDNIELLLQKAAQDSRNLALDQDILTDETTEEILAKTEQQALSLKETAKIEASTEAKPKEESKSEDKPAEEPVKEEKKEEAPAEEPVQEEEAKPEEEAQPEEPKEEPKEEAPAEESKPEEPKEEPKEEAPAEESKPEETPTEEPTTEPAEEEKKEESPAEEPVEEKPVEEEKQEEVGPEPEPTSEPNPTPEAQKDAALDIIEATKKQFAKEEPENKSEIVEEKPAIQEVPSASDLVQEEKTKAEAEKPKKDANVEAGENLFEKLKKQGTLREEN